LGGNVKAGVSSWLGLVVIAGLLNCNHPYVELRNVRELHNIERSCVVKDERVEVRLDIPINPGEKAWHVEFINNIPADLEIISTEKFTTVTWSVEKEKIKIIDHDPYKVKIYTEKYSRTIHVRLKPAGAKVLDVVIFVLAGVH